jgi:hypothetical protein
MGSTQKCGGFIIFAFYLFTMEDLLRILFPTWVFEHFDLEKVEDDACRIDVYFGEKKVIPIATGHLISKGFTDYSLVQDFPIRGKAVYLHLRRRKWVDVETGEVTSRKFDIAYDGTRLTHEFVAFLKESH